MKVSVKYNSKDPGVFKAILNVMVDSFYNMLSTVEVNATSVDFSVYLIDQLGQRLGITFLKFINKDSVNFKQIYIGASMKISAFLVNNTPERLVFKNKIRQGIISKAQKQSLITP